MLAYVLLEGKWKVKVLESGFTILLPSRLGLLNRPTASLQRGKTPPNECPGYDTK